ncbi:MAG: GrpB family protein [Paenibacillus sp.]|nr:GrpB family protein [Paenibacillus sp.]
MGLLIVGNRLLTEHIQHVGSTALPGTLTKGDLDIQVQIPKTHRV